ncbi:protein OPAQUE10 isoform X2 [Setaria italica]|uniref:protein OPAQUE10 isoform X2 n=1 Tax=Setaria italica TaxID=4555 RepID=UPI000351119F|nr:protein OPAQUE10 isoform X2 [Setaria italica]
MSLHAERGGAHEDLSWSTLGKRAAPLDVIVGDRGGGVGMRRAQQQGGPAGAVRVDEASSASTFRELDDAFLQKQTKIWLGEVLHLRFDEDVLVADLLADGELLFQVSKVLWKRLLKKNREQLKQSKVYIYEKLSFGRSNGKYMPYSKVDSFLKICQILGLAGIDLFTPSDVVEKRNVRKVCICIRSVSKKSHMMRLNVPDFDIVTYTISMPNYIVGGICRSLEQPQYSSSGSSGYSPRDSSKALQQQNDEHGDTNYDSDEAESRLSVLEPEDSVDEDNFAAVLSQLSNAPNPKEESEGYGESGHGMHEEKSLAESVGSLNFVVDSESVDSTPQNHDKESYSTHSATDQCSRTRTAKCSLSSEESDSISSHLAFEIDKNDPELNAHPVEDSERIYDGQVKSLDHSIQGNGETLADHPKKEGECIQKDTGTMNLHCDALACDRESVCSSCEESRHGLNGEPSDLSSESHSGLNPTHTTGGKLPMVSEDPVNNIEPSMIGMTNDSTSEELNPEFSDTNQMEGSQSVDKPVESEDIAQDSITPENNIEPSMIGMTNDSTSEELNPEFSDTSQMEGSQSVDKPVESENIAQDSIAAQRSEDDAPKSGKGVLKSVAGGITLVGAVFFMVHLRRSKERSFTRVMPSLSEKSIQSDSRRAKNMDNEKVSDVYPGARLKV